VINSREHLQEELRRQTHAEPSIHDLRTYAPLPTSSSGTMHRSKQLFQMKRQTTSGSARPARSRATSTTTQEVGCTSTRKASSTTARRSRSREKLLLSKPAKPRLTHWATRPKCSPGAKTSPTSAWVYKPHRLSFDRTSERRFPVALLQRSGEENRLRRRTKHSTRCQ
jgi:hypothetical protein